MQHCNQGHIKLKIVLLITKTEDEEIINDAMQELKIPIFFHARGQGTATSEILDICGLSGTNRLITAVVIPEILIKETISHLNKLLTMNKKGQGIAIVIPISGIQNSVMGIYDNNLDKGEKIEKMKKNYAYSMILVATNYGYSDNVIDAARAVGAKGGTIIKGRRRGLEEALHFLGITLQEEQEFTMIIVPREKKSETMMAVNQACGLKTPAHGIVLSIPIEEAMGIEE